MEKVLLFSEILSETFSTRTEAGFDEIFYSEVEASVKSKDFASGNFDSFTSKELAKVVNKLKINSSPGGDNIHNLFLKKLPFEYIKNVLLKLVNRAAKSGMPESWKVANVTMVPKKTQKSRDPADYRPISLLSCIDKVAED